MSSLLCVRWTIKPLITPRPLLPCSGCRKPQAFHSSGKFRLNANGRRLDAWLLYRCAICETTWKLPVVERRSVKALEPAFLRALQSNDATLAESVAFDLAGLRRFAGQIEVSSEITAEKTAVSRITGAPSRLEIGLSLPYPVALRADRLLARELGLSRERVRKMEKTGRLYAVQEKRLKLRRPIADRLRIILDLSGENDRQTIALLAAGNGTARPDDGN